MAVKTIEIVIPLYEDFDILDVCGPFGMFSASGSLNSEVNLQPVLASVKPGSVKSLQGIRFVTEHALSEFKKPEVIWVPGGNGPGFDKSFDMKSDYLKWLKDYGSQAKWITSVCTGALILGAAGLLEGYTATTHWMFQSNLAQFPSVKLASGFPRYWIDRNRFTGGGISSGLDASLALISILAGDEAAMSAQLMNQYAPDPPFNAGTPLTAAPGFLGNFFTYNGDLSGQLAEVIRKYQSQMLPVKKGK